MKQEMQKPPLTIAMAQMPIAHQPMTNADRFLEEARKAVAKGAQIVVGSEMMLYPYLCGDRYEDEAFVDEVWRTTQYIERESASIGAVLIWGGLGLDIGRSIGEDGRVRKYNAAFVAQEGRLLHNRIGRRFTTKTLLPNYRIFDDARHFFSTRKLALELGVLLEDLLTPFHVTIAGTVYNLGIMLCEDMWDSDYAQHPAQILKEHGADILINLSCSNWSWRKNAKRDQIIRDICLDTGLPFVYVNNIGCQNNSKNFITFDGSSTIYNRGGEIVAMAEAYKEETIVTTITKDLPALKREEKSDVAELFDAIVVATRGFLETVPESTRQKVVIGASGGIDSALSIAFFAHLMGPENVIAINMPYKDYNADDTKQDAADLCERLGVHYRVEPIDDIVDITCRLAEIVPGTSQHKTEQAITRMTVLAAIASQTGGFFPSNANWTEIAFGYGTLNGDMRGTFAPWMNCTKQDVYRLANYVNQVVYGREVVPQSIIDRPPMDELVPQGEGIRRDPFDYGTVHENGYHDQMVRAIVAFRWGKETFVEHYISGTLERELKLRKGKIVSLFENSEEWLKDLERCFALFNNAIFKRVQSVPGPLLDKRSFGWDFRESILPDIRTTCYGQLCMLLQKEMPYRARVA